LRGKADVFRNGGNARNSSYGLEKLDRWLGDRKWDVIHFNWGLWDVCYRNPKSKAKGHRDKINGTITSTPDFYRETMSKIISRLQETGAVLIWCTTTPIPDQEVGRKVGDEIIYNKIVKDLIEGSSIITNDLHSYILPKWKNVMKKKGDVHYTDEGYQYLARKVSDVIESAIER
jgi:hypothetical protein